MPPVVAESSVRWNGAIHGFHAATLAAVLGVLLSVPLSARENPVHPDGETTERFRRGLTPTVSARRSSPEDVMGLASR